MLVLGINIGHDSGACLVDETGVRAAVNEERLSRVKMHTGVPYKAIDEVFRISGLNPKDITDIAMEGKNMTPQPDPNYDPKECRWTKRLAMKLGVEKFLLGTRLGMNTVHSVFKPFSVQDQLRVRGFLREKGITGKFRAYDHHRCHAASAYYTQSKDRGLAITLDASGEGYCSRVYVCENNQMKLVHSIFCYHSPAYYYGSITQILGYKPLRHEGKITGLAAFGKPEAVTEILKNYIDFESHGLTFVNRGGFYVTSIVKLKEDLKGFTPADIAAGIQAHTEKIVCDYISAVVKRFSKEPKTPLFLSGGLFANVKVNQRIVELPQVESVYVFPNMGDGGLNVGAALAHGFDHKAFKKKPDISTVYWGYHYTEKEIANIVQRCGLHYRKPDHLAREIASLIHQGKVVGRFDEAMEYGPRALGNRSIVYSAHDPQVNQWLNQRLRRTEFMPFAPFVREEDAEEYFEVKGKDYKPYRFMTMTCDVTEKCKREAPGIVHVDGTARPQIVRRKDNPGYYDILTQYKELTGVGVLVNTSFNMHEEPIVNSPEEAIETFRQGKLDVLAIGEFLIES